MSRLAYDYVIFYSVLVEMNETSARGGCVPAAGQRYTFWQRKSSHGVTCAKCSSTAAEDGKNETRREGIEINIDCMRWDIVNN